MTYASPRQTPILLEPHEEQDLLELTLPPGATVDEMPQPRMAKTAFGSYSVTWKADGGSLSRDLTLRITRSTLPAESYQEVRSFLESFREAERLPVVVQVP